MVDTDITVERRFYRFEGTKTLGFAINQIALCLRPLILHAIPIATNRQAQLI